MKKHILRLIFELNLSYLSVMRVVTKKGYLNDMTDRNINRWRNAIERTIQRRDTQQKQDIEQFLLD